MTVHTLAQGIRKRSIRLYGERAFAEMGMRFHQQFDALELQGDDELLEKVVGVLVSSQDTMERQLALCWLDTNGYGSIPLTKLLAIVRQQREDAQE